MIIAEGAHDIHGKHIPAADVKKVKTYVYICAKFNFFGAKTFMHLKACAFNTQQYR